MEPSWLLQMRRGWAALSVVVGGGLHAAASFGWTGDPDATMTALANTVGFVLDAIAAGLVLWSAAKPNNKVLGS